IPPLQIQRNNRELEMVIKECILEAVRESVPVEKILRAYLDETVEENVETVITTVEPEKVEGEEPKSVDGEGVQVGGADTPVNIEIPTPAEDDISTTMENAPVALSMQIDESVEPKSSMESTESPESPTKSLTFSNIDQAQNPDNTVANILAPKDVSTLERISDENHAKRLLEEADDEEDDEDKIQIMDGDANISLDVTPL
ncbi:unnamed protein product, partial [marine sediment metagenome]